MSAPVRGARGDYSKGIRRSRRDSGLPAGVQFGLLAVALAGVVVLVVADFSTLITVKVSQGSTPYDVVKGHEEHGWAMALIGVLALPMLYGAVAGGSRPAWAAVAALGLVGVLIALIHDAPDLSKTGLCGQRFEDCHAGAATGFYLETLGAVLLVLAGGTALLLGGSESRGGRTRDASAEPDERAAEPASEPTEA